LLAAAACALPPAAAIAPRVHLSRRALHLASKVRDKMPKWREMRNARLSLLWYLVARGKQQEKYSLAGRVCQS